MQIHSAHITWLNKTKQQPSIVVVGELTLLHYVWDSKAAQINIRRSLIQEIMLFMSSNWAAGTKKKFVVWKMKVQLITVR